MYCDSCEKLVAENTRLRAALEACDKIATQEPTTGRLMRLEILAVTQAALRAEQPAESEGKK